MNTPEEPTNIFSNGYKNLTLLLSLLTTLCYATTIWILQQPQLRTNMEKSFKENFLSDPSTYPIIFIMGFALTFMTGMGLHALAYYKDVRISPSKKHSELQTWGQEKVNPIVKVIGEKNPYYRPTFTEGLGVDHEEWVKAKAAEMNQNH